MIATPIKQFFYPLYILPKIFLFKKQKLKRLFQFYKQKALLLTSLSFRSAGLKVFSNMEEDGIILCLIASLNIEKGTFIDIGSNDCINSNCANLVFNFDWEGIFVDADRQLLKIGERNYKLFGKTQRLNLKFIQRRLTPENINAVIDEHRGKNEIDFMSIDIDGNDYYIWQALTCVKPKIVMIENKIEYGWYDIAVPADSSHFKPHEWGASPLALTKLAAEKGYTLVASNKKGFNIFFLRNDLMRENIPALKLKDLLNDPEIKKDFYDSNYMEQLIKKLEVVK
jgi:hypothetical protein